jgi:type II secretory pathway pseudopilin PulG
LIVIVVLGILATIVVFAVGDSNENALRAACKSDLHVVQSASERYLIDWGTEPQDLDTLRDLGYIKGTPVNVRIEGGEVISSCDTLTPTTSPVLALTPELKASVVSAVTNRSGNSDRWRATITIRVTDEDDAAVDFVGVEGTWSNGETNDNGCTTGVAGTCTFYADHSTTNASTARTWVLDALNKPGNSDSHSPITVACRRSTANNGNTVCIVS